MRRGSAGRLSLPSTVAHVIDCSEGAALTSTHVNDVVTG